MSLTFEQSAPIDRPAAWVKNLRDLILYRGESTATWIRVPLDPLQADSCDTYSFNQVLGMSRTVAESLHAEVPEGSRVVLVFDNGPEFLASFFGAILAGVTPVPIHPPGRARRPLDHAARLRRIVEEADVRAILVDDSFAETCSADVPLFPWTVLRRSAAPGLPAVTTSPTDAAFIQYSSGSTRDPIGVSLTHRAVLNNVAAVAERLVTKRALCWLPLFHDMGLAGLMLQSLYQGAELVLMKPGDFISNPARWLWAMSRFQVDLCAAPNFAYAVCADPNRIPTARLAGIDLRAWRYALNGSEAVQVETTKVFLDRFAPHGFRREALMPVYGLAEDVVACSFDSEVHVDEVDRSALEKGSRAVPALPGGRTKRYTSVGTPLTGQSVRIMDDESRAAEDRMIGEVQVQSNSVMTEYVGKPEQTKAAFTSDGWLRTGDLGYWAEGRLYITGRSKDVIKRAGLALDASDVGEVVGAVEGVRAGCVAAFGVPSSSRGTEEIVVVAETTVTDKGRSKSLRGNIARRLSEAFRTHADQIILVPAGSLPKTSSGKIRNGECLRMHLSGELSSTS